MKEYPHLAAIAAPDEHGLWRYTSGAQPTWDIKTPEEICADVERELTACSYQGITSTSHSIIIPWSTYWIFYQRPLIRAMLSRRRKRRPARFTYQVRGL